MKFSVTHAAGLTGAAKIFIYRLTATLALRAVALGAVCLPSVSLATGQPVLFLLLVVPMVPAPTPTTTPSSLPATIGA